MRGTHTDSQTDKRNERGLASQLQSILLLRALGCGGLSASQGGSMKKASPVGREKNKP